MPLIRQITLIEHALNKWNQTSQQRKGATRIRLANIFIEFTTFKLAIPDSL